MEFDEALPAKTRLTAALHLISWMWSEREPTLVYKIMGLGTEEQTPE
jgi:hypothetical protein